ncbi:hypothetical protein HPB49_011701 [Dermacentor silvarum]|uniref:Uncharacterized protein n=1 Tax=Dermacentor silvarum TaxID=543639 RepID=A0ACB8C3F0_DERSI|nr:hypothetical protein HPB49_011701 [Dermacentor silvarum]
MKPTYARRYARLCARKVRRRTLGSYHYRRHHRGTTSRLPPSLKWYDRNSDRCLPLPRSVPSCHTIRMHTATQTRSAVRRRLRRHTNRTHTAIQTLFTVPCLPCWRHNTVNGLLSQPGPNGNLSDGPSSVGPIYGALKIGDHFAIIVENQDTSIVSALITQLATRAALIPLRVAWMMKTVSPSTTAALAGK